MTKIRLNDAQWHRLQRLSDDRGRRAPAEAPDVSRRLTSNGLVALDKRGSEYLTEQGALRLSQGR
jgi:hypothetical protein